MMLEGSKMKMKQELPYFHWRKSLDIKLQQCSKTIVQQCRAETMFVHQIYFFFLLVQLCTCLISRAACNSTVYGAARFIFRCATNSGPWRLAPPLHGGAPHCHSLAPWSGWANCCRKILRMTLFVAVLGRDGRGTTLETCTAKGKSQQIIHTYTNVGHVVC